MGPDHSMIWWFFAICLGVLGLGWTDLALRGGEVRTGYLLLGLVWFTLAVVYAVKARRKKCEENQTDTDETTVK